MLSRSRKLLSAAGSWQRHYTTSRSSKSKAKSTKIGVFGDIHFQEKGLDRITTAGNWIIDTFKDKNVASVVCLGDVLNTREQVSVRALSGAMNFFDTMSRKLQVPIHVLLGNHDMNLKHSTKVSSLDALGTTAMKRGDIHVHRRTVIEEVASKPCLMIPYHENQRLIMDQISNLVDENGAEYMSKVTAFGHLGINGAIQNSSTYTYISDLAPHAFAPLRRTFSGHFHAHQTLPSNIVYVGAPLQFNFGDAGADRGVVIYDVETDEWEFIVNPHGYQYIKIKDTEVGHILKADPNRFKDAFVMIQYSGISVSPKEHDDWKKQLHQAGALMVFKETDSMKNLRETGKQLDMKIKKQQSIEEQVTLFAEHARKLLTDKPEGTKKKKAKTPLQAKWEVFLAVDSNFKSILEKGLQTVRDTKQTAEGISAGAGFNATLKKLTMTNFMGIQGTVEVPLGIMKNGIWLIEGDNGSGKSTVFEAIVWCQFGEFLRSGMQKDYAINDNHSVCSVRLEYASGMIIERSRKRGRTESLKTFQRDRESGEEVYLADKELGELRHTQKLLDDTLGIDYDTFSKSVVLGQNIFNNFVSGSKEQRRTIIEEMLGLDKFNAYFEHCKAERVDIEAQAGTITTLLSEARREVSIFEKQISVLEEELTKVNSRHVERTEDLTKLQARKSRTLGDLEKQKMKLISELSDAQSRLSELESARQLVAPSREAAAALRAKESHLDVLSSNDSSCPSCGQAIDANHVHKLVEDARCHIIDTVSKFPFLEQVPKITTPTDAYEALVLLRQLLDEESSSTESSYMATESAIRFAEMKLMKLDNDILRAENDFNKEESEIGKSNVGVENEQVRLTALLEQSRTYVESQRTSIEQHTKDLEEINFRLNVVKFWEMAFDKTTKGSTGVSTIRSFIFEDVVAELNSIIDTYVEQLTSTTPLKVTLTADLDIEEIYGKRSGGERKRTDLAVLFALYEIVRDRSRYHPNFIMLDEIFDALDKNGRQMVGQVLSTLAKNVDKVFVITHTDIATGLSLAGVITAEKQENIEDGTTQSVITVTQM